MDFANNSQPLKFYKEMMLKLYQNYVYHYKQDNDRTLHYILQPETAPASSLEEILAQDSRAVLDKIKHTALSIAYRIKINKEIDRQLDYNWYNINSELLHVEQFYPVRDRGSERRRSTLTSELFKIYKNHFDEAVQCWKDLQEPMRYFINLFHQYKSLKQDKKLLEER